MISSEKLDCLTRQCCYYFSPCRLGCTSSSPLAGYPVYSAGNDDDDDDKEEDDDDDDDDDDNVQGGQVIQRPLPYNQRLTNLDHPVLGDPDHQHHHVLQLLPQLGVSGNDDDDEDDEDDNHDGLSSRTRCSSAQSGAARPLPPSTEPPSPMDSRWSF